MKFSIITPSFNQGRFIRDCLESVRQQHGVDREHLVVDGGSTDETLAILKQYPHVQWTSEPDQGMSDAINKGFVRARGDWLMWLNTDDYLLPGALARVAEFAAAHPAADVIYGETLFVDETGRVLRRKRDHRFDFRVLLFYGCYIPSTATFLRRRIIDEGHLLDVRYRNCMDFEYYVRLSAAGYHFAYVPAALAAFRWHGKNLSTQFVARRRAERLAVQREYLRRRGLGWLAHRPVLAVLARLYQAKRLYLRLATHRE